MVSFYDLFNGPSHDIDPAGMGYVGPTGDELAHPWENPWYRPNEAGLARMTEALAAVEIEPVERP